MTIFNFAIYIDYYSFLFSISFEFKGIIPSYYLIYFISIISTWVFLFFKSIIKSRKVIYLSDIIFLS